MSILFKYPLFHEQRFQLFFTIGLFTTLTFSLITSTFLSVFNIHAPFLSIPIESLSVIFLTLLYFYPLPTKEQRKLDPFNVYQGFFYVFRWKNLSNFKRVIYLMALIPWAVFNEFSGQSIFLWFDIFKFAVLGFYLFRIVRETMSPIALKTSIIFFSILLAIHGISMGWLLIEGYQDHWLTAYNKAFYWAMTTLTTIGYGDITPTTNISRLYTTVIMVIGVGVYGIILGNISRLLLNSDRHKEAKKEKINDMAAFLNYYQIPPKLRREVFSYYHSMFSRHLSDKDNQIIGELPVVLQDELKLYMKVKLVKELSIFSDLKVSCLRLIATMLEDQSYSPGQNIIKKGDHGEEMFIIYHGEVEVIVEDNVVATIMEGQFFGEVALVKNVTRTADVQSKSYCELYTLKKEDFIEIVSKFPELEERFKKQYQKRTTDQDEAPVKKAS